MFSYLQNAMLNRHAADSLVCVSELFNPNVYFDVGGFFIQQYLNILSSAECAFKV
jgi:hypothetical protein